MGLELVIFIIAILLGIFIYWRESNGNAAYRFLNKLVNSKELQMSPNNPKGFVFKQAFLPRLIFVVSSLLIIALILQFLTPLNIFGSYNGVSVFSSIAVGVLAGTYVANFVLKSTKIIEEKSDSFGNLVDDAIEKGKNIIDDLKTEDAEEVNEEVIKEQPKEKKSARERLKDKGLM